MTGPYTPLLVSRRPLGCLIEVAETLVLTIIIFLAIQTFVAQPYRVEQESMRMTLEQDQYVLVDKLTPHFDDYSRGDIVVFHPIVRDASCDDDSQAESNEGTVPFIKRVIGMPGDSISLVDGEVLVNGVALVEPYVFSGPTSPIADESEWTIAPGRLFVMGDNRSNSTDSRSERVGPICIRDVIGRAWLRYWPLNALGILQTPTYPNVPPPASGGANQPGGPITQRSI